MRVALVTATRGDGGQNEIGTELFDALGILRTEELLAAHRFDGAEQYFTRAVDFGYSFSHEETLEKWGRQEILGDFVRHIRTLRPDVIVTLSPEGTGGGQHHQTSAVLRAEAFRAAADPAQFPEQIREACGRGRRKKLYRPAGGFGGRRRARRSWAEPAAAARPGRGQRGAGRNRPRRRRTARFATLDTNVYEPLLGCTIGEVGGVASGMHMCQGRAPLVPPPGARRRATAWSRRCCPKRSATRTRPRSSTGSTSRSAAWRALPASGRRSAGARRSATITARVDAASRALGSRGPAAAVPDLRGV